MTLTALLKNAWETTKENVKTRRYLQNYPNDILAGNISRTPVYATIDNAVLGVGDAQVVGSMVNSLVVSCFGWSLFYTFGNSMLASLFGDFYQKHAKKFDAVYSAVMTFGFGMGVNMAAGYTLEEALAASTIRAAIAIPLGPLTRYYTDSFRDVRGEPVIAKDTSFKGKSWKYNLPRVAAMIMLPLTLVAGTVTATPDKEVLVEEPQAVIEYIDKREIPLEMKEVIAV